MSVISIDIDTDKAAELEAHARELGFVDAADWAFTLLRDNSVAARVTAAYQQGEPLGMKASTALRKAFGPSRTERAIEERSAQEAIATAEAANKPSDPKA